MATNRSGMIGSLLKESRAVSHFAVLSHTVESEQEQWGPRMQSIALDLWKLKAPTVLISITGGAQDFNLSRVDNDRLMQGLMQVATDTSVWFITGGTNAGIMRLVGAARTQYAADAPLIGISAWAVVKGTKDIEQACGRNGGDQLILYNPKADGMVALDDGHTHFFLIKGNGNNYGDEIASRAKFEAQVSKGRESTVTEMPQEHDQWMHVHLTNYSKWKEQRVDNMERAQANQTDQSNSSHTVPSVLVCVQGGPGTVQTVKSAVEAGTPALIVKGSGKASDVIADMVFITSSGALRGRQLSKRQGSLRDFLTVTLAVCPLAWQPGEELSIDHIDFIKNHRHGMQTFTQILAEYWDEQAAQNSNTQNAFMDALRVSQNPLCRVFDLEGKEDFSDAMLDCIFHGLEHQAQQQVSGAQHAGGMEDRGRIEAKLRLAVEFNNLRVLKAQVKLEQETKGFNDAMCAALDTALLKRGRHHIVDYLINNGASISGYWMRDDLDPVVAAENTARWQRLLATVKGNVTKRPKRRWGGLQRRGSMQNVGNEPFAQQFSKIVQRYIGEGFSYSMSLVSPEFDLMILAVLRNELNLAFVWWKEYKFPVRSALSIVMLFRNLARNTDVVPHDNEALREGADFFEELAWKVQNFCLERDYLLGISNLECPMLIWQGNTLVDVSYRSSSEVFFEKCCREAIDRRFAGDLRAYSQSIWVLHGLKLTVLVNVLCGGVFAPFLMEYNEFPEAENLRYPTQRIKVPDVWRKKSQRMQCYSEAKEEVVENQEWTLDEWWHKFKLFWQAPVTLFITGAVQKTFLVAIFTWWLFTTPDETKREPFYNSKGPSPAQDDGVSLGWEIWPFEAGMCLMFLSSVLAEAVQLYILGSAYWDFWNFLDITSIGFFFAGFAMRYVCSNNELSCTDPKNWDQINSVRVDGMWVYMYSVCVSLLWIRMLRVLSVSKRLGPLVILIVRMGWDISLFAVVYAVFLLAFSVLIRGSMPFDYSEGCLGDESPETPAKCWTMWWIIRTFVQASGGEIYMDDMKTDAAVIGLMLLWVVMNLLLLNLVIAIMSSTYDAVKEKSYKVYLFDLYEIANEFARRSAAAPWPINAVAFLIDLYYFLTVERGKCKFVWRKQSNRAMLDLYIRRNLTMDDLYNHALHLQYCKQKPGSDVPVATHGENAPVSSGGEHSESDHQGRFPPDESDESVVRARIAEMRRNVEQWKLVERDMEVEQFWEMKMGAFMERARNEFLQSNDFQHFKDKWNITTADDTNDSDLVRGLDPSAEHSGPGGFLSSPVPLQRSPPSLPAANRYLEPDPPVAFSRIPEADAEGDIEARGKWAALSDQPGQDVELDPAAPTANGAESASADPETDVHLDFPT